MSYIRKEKAVAFLRGEAIRKYPSSFALGLGAAAREIENMEEAKVSDVKHGEWSYDNHRDMCCVTTGWYFCSVCDNGWERLEGVRPTAYCPHCGAKMDGERREQ